MPWITKDDVKKASDVFLSWFGRIAVGTSNTYDDEVYQILQGQEDSFVNLVAKLLNLDTAGHKAFATAPVSFNDLQAACPGITTQDVAGLDDKQKKALLTIAKLHQK